MEATAVVTSIASLRIVVADRAAAILACHAAAVGGTRLDVAARTKRITHALAYEITQGPIRKIAEDFRTHFHAAYGKRSR